MASKNLTFNFFGNDKTASATMNSLGGAAVAVGKKVALAAAAIAAALAVVVVRFGVDSVKAAAEAETQQLALTAAWEKFPAVADLAIEKLREYNEELAKKTKFDDESIGTGQAVLAQFGLTGKQIQKLTPLLLDYASKTGKDLPSSAEDLGKALLGQGRALKALGIEFQDTGDLAGNFDQLMVALSDKVGGFAEKEGTTAAGKLAILQNRFGEVQEAIGFALLPVLDDLLNIVDDDLLPMLEDFSGWFKDEGLPNIREFVGWVIQYKDVLGPAAVAVGVLATAQWGLNAAMLANPIGASVAAVVAGVALLIGAIVALQTNAFGAGRVIIDTYVSIGKALGGLVQSFANGFISILNALNAPLNALRSALGLPTISLGYVNYTAAFDKISNQYNGTGVNPGSMRLLTGKNRVNAGQFAEGGIVPHRPGGWDAVVGEGGQDEAIIPLDRLGNLGGGTQVHFHFPTGTIIGSQRDAMQWLERAYKTARGTGAIPGTAFSG